MTNYEITIKTLDVQNLLSGDSRKKAEFIVELGQAFKEIGFVVISGHNVTAELQKKSYEMIHDFFHLPLETKKQYEIPGIGGARGYTPFGREHAKYTNVGDLKEFFHVGIEVPDTNPLSKEYPKNVSVKEVNEFDKTLRALYSSLLDLGTHLLRAIALSLDQPENFFDEKVQYGNSILRPIHYPPLSGDEQPNAVRSSAHEDINLITLLIGASNPGLEVLTRAGKWLSITTQPTEIVVNVGDMLQRLSNYKLVSTTHRVVNPPAQAKGRKEETRYSIPFFLHPVSHMSLAALESCVDSEHPAKDPPITAGEYLHQRLREIGLI